MYTVIPRFSLTSVINGFSFRRVFSRKICLGFVGCLRFCRCFVGDYVVFSVNKGFDHAFVCLVWRCFSTCLHICIVCIIPRIYENSFVYFRCTFGHFFLKASYPWWDLKSFQIQKTIHMWCSRLLILWNPCVWRWVVRM